MNTTIQAIDIAYAFGATIWTVAMLLNSREMCKTSCEQHIITKCLMSWVFGMVLLTSLYYSLRWVITG